MLPSLVPIAAKKPAGRQSNNINKSSSSSSSLPSINNNSTLIVLATIASQVYNLILQIENRQKIITSLKTQYTIDRNLQKRIEEVVVDVVTYQTIRRYVIVIVNWSIERDMFIVN